MKIEAVVVCIDYADFLSHTLPQNKNLFEKLVVVTDTKDIKTKKLCEFYNVECVQTDVFYEDSPTVPNKSRGINAGLERLSKDGWVLQMDADIWLPPLTRQILQNYPLDEKGLYSMDRLMCNSYEEWYNFQHIQHRSVLEGWIYLHTDLFPMGTRIVQYHGDGYMPIGYIQLWNPKGSGVYDYPVEKSGFDRTDVVHLKRWERKNRHLIADMVCIHLASEQHSQAQNWFGRKTQLFRPKENTCPAWCKWVEKGLNKLRSLSNWFKSLWRKLGYYIKFRFSY